MNTKLLHNRAAQLTPSAVRAESCVRGSAYAGSVGLTPVCDRARRDFPMIQGGEQ